MVNEMLIRENPIYFPTWLSYLHQIWFLSTQKLLVFSENKELFLSNISILQRLLYGFSSSFAVVTSYEFKAMSTGSI